MVAGVCYSDMAVSGDRQPLGSIEGVSRSVHKGQERPTAVKHLLIKSSRLIFATTFNNTFKIPHIFLQFKFYKKWSPIYKNTQDNPCVKMISDAVAELFILSEF